MAKKQPRKYFDYPMLFVVLFLVGFGLVMIYSTSSYTSQIRYGNTTHWLVRQAAIAAGSLFLMFLVTRIDYRIFKKKAWANMAYAASIISLLAVLALGVVTKGSKRWISIGGIQLQPSEFAKLFLIVFLAYYLSVNSHKIKTFWGSLKWVLICLPIIGLVIVENLSTAIVLCAITGILIFVISPCSKQLIGLAAGVVGLGTAYLVFGPAYRMERIQIWLDPEHHEKGLQTMQSLYAIGSGGIFGKGLGQSMQKMGFIPESHNDMIFSIVCEELGLFGAFAVIAIFLVLIWRMLIIAMNAQDLFGSLIAIGVAVHVSIQMLINVGVVTNLFPPTGIPLPFISYGGSSLMVLLLEMGLVLSVSRQIKI
ncbi:cell division protein FtsW [Anaerostipes sp. 992a]|uniref:putative lipid II flippase FtsW n=1 Tax=Anaerostipes sp. 992a TaxID=1261637 RepID=UPI00095294DD|nr:putative lipid II flippase FtsW [Anaerostipes sp. 992a]OLR62405.1 cell division protein FtsW [Anaerostipes sp. 992a]